MQWAFSQHWSASVEYDYYGFGHRVITVSDPTNAFLGTVDVGQHIQFVKVGLNFRVWGAGW